VVTAGDMACEAWVFWIRVNEITRKVCYSHDFASTL
jgi:hypothetical protein